MPGATSTSTSTLIALTPRITEVMVLTSIFPSPNNNLFRQRTRLLQGEGHVNPLPRRLVTKEREDLRGQNSDLGIEFRTIMTNAGGPRIVSVFLREERRRQCPRGWELFILHCFLNFPLTESTTGCGMLYEGKGKCHADTWLHRGGFSSHLRSVFEGVSWPGRFPLANRRNNRLMGGGNNAKLYSADFTFLFRK